MFFSKLGPREKGERSEPFLIEPSLKLGSSIPPNAHSIEDEAGNGVGTGFPLTCLFLWGWDIFLRSCRSPVRLTEQDLVTCSDVCVFPTPHNSPTPAGCPTLLHSDAACR